MNGIISAGLVEWEKVQQMMEGLGFGASETESTPAGGIKGIQEDTANVLAGTLNSMRIINIRQAELADASLSHLIRIEYNTAFTRNVVEELRDIKSKMGMGTSSLLTDRSYGR